MSRSTLIAARFSGANILQSRLVHVNTGGETRGTLLIPPFPLRFLRVFHCVFPAIFCVIWVFSVYFGFCFRCNATFDRSLTTLFVEELQVATCAGAELLAKPFERDSTVVLHWVGFAAVRNY